MNSKLLEFSTYYLNLPLKNIFFQLLLTALRKLTAIDEKFLVSENEKKIIFFLEKLAK